MPLTRKLKIAIITSLSAISIAGISWWLYLTYTFVQFAPLMFDKQKGFVSTETVNDFYKNLRFVLKYRHIKHKLDILNHPLIQLKVAKDKELICDLTEKAQDIVWLYYRMNEKHPSFPCQGEGYQGLVFRKEKSYHMGGDSAVAIDLTCEDIALAEQILKTKADQAGGISKWHPEIKLPLYYRQYFGYRNASGETIIYVNLVLKKVVSLSGLLDQLHHIYDGGSAYWQTTINLTRKTIDSITVNGSA